MPIITCEPFHMDVGNHKVDVATSAISECVRGVLARYPTVAAGYLFGSAATATQGPLSDIDVAVLLSDVAAPAELAGEIQDALCRELRTDAVDLVTLREAPVALAYRVIRDGRCVLCHNDKLRIRFTTSTIMRYLDFKPVRDRAFRVLRDKILEAA